MLARVYNGPYWERLDRGEMEYAEAARRLAGQFGGDEAEYMRALTGWIELKTPIDEGFRAAQRRRAGKRLYLLSNYPREGYLRMREKFADRFGELFDGGVISYACHLVKPEKAIYEKLIADCGLDPAHTLFIDDTLPNVEGAMKMGINGFHMHEKGMMDRFFL